MPAFRHERRLEIAWGDCDPAGIVFHPRYFEWFDAAAAALFCAATGMRKREMLARFGIVGIPAVETGASFRSACRYGDTVRIVSQVAEFKRSSFLLRHDLHNGDTRAGAATSTRVWAGHDPADPARLRSVPLPPELTALFDREAETLPPRTLPPA